MVPAVAVNNAFFLEHRARTRPSRRTTLYDVNKHADEKILYIHIRGTGYITINIYIYKYNKRNGRGHRGVHTAITTTTLSWTVSCAHAYLLYNIILSVVDDHIIYGNIRNEINK